MKQLTEEEFDSQYSLVDNPFDDNASFNGHMFETYGEELHYVLAMAKVNRVVTIIEGDDDDLYYASGYHLVNRWGYLITNELITEDFEVKLED